MIQRQDGKKKTEIKNKFEKSFIQNNILENHGFCTKIIRFKNIFEKFSILRNI